MNYYKSKRINKLPHSQVMSIEEVRWLVSVINRRGILDVFAVRWHVVTRSLGSIDTNDITLGIS